MSCDVDAGWSADCKRTGFWSIDRNVAGQIHCSAIANNTLPDSCYTTHALVFMLGGILTRWKQTTAYELTGHSFHAETVEDKLNVIITACESVGLKIHGIISDIGPCNRALWRLYGIQVTKTKRQCYAPHPNDASRNQYFVADVPHLLKNLRGHLTKYTSPQRYKIHLPTDVVAKMKLPTDVVSTQHVEKLVELEDSEFCLAPRLKKSCLSAAPYGQDDMPWRAFLTSLTVTLGTVASCSALLLLKAKRFMFKLYSSD